MIVEADEVRDRIAAQVATLYGYGAGDDPFDPGMSPANVAARVFAVVMIFLASCSACARDDPISSALSTCVASGPSIWSFTAS